MVLLCRQPIRRLWIIELSLAGCLIAPWLGMIPGYPQLAIRWSVARTPHTVTRPTDSPAILSAAKNLAAENSPAIEGEILCRPTLRVGARQDDAAGVTSGPTVEPTETPDQAWNVGLWLGALYLVAIALGVAWWLVGVAALVRIIRTANPAPPRCLQLLAEIAGPRSTRVRLLVSHLAKQPFASGWWATTIVLPEGLCDDEQAVRWALAHEWTHIERRDFRAWFVAGLAHMLFFYQPLVWWLRRQLRLCQDFLADARASRQAPRPEDYAEFLTVRAAAGSLHPAMVGLGMGFSKSELYRRVIMLVKNLLLESRPPRLWTVSVTCAALALVAVVGAPTISPQAAAQGAKKSGDGVVREAGGVPRATSSASAGSQGATASAQ